MEDVRHGYACRVSRERRLQPTFARLVPRFGADGASLSEQLDDFEWYNRGASKRYTPLDDDGSPVKISSQFDSGNIEIVDASDHENVRLKIRPEPFTKGTDNKYVNPPTTALALLVMTQSPGPDRDGLAVRLPRAIRVLT